MNKILEKYGLHEIEPFTFQETKQYVSCWQRELANEVTADTSQEDLAQLAHAIQRLGYADGFGLQDVYLMLYVRRDTARKAEEQEAMQ
ncbi:hypothetical protein [Thiolapillus sp.]|uniref:hypothetical protein n=1 Tax=Thiolapillus sp. TaxID=2017437 RepID=UPI003AF7FEC0